MLGFYARLLNKGGVSKLKNNYKYYKYEQINDIFESCNQRNI